MRIQLKKTKLLINFALLTSTLVFTRVDAYAIGKNPVGVPIQELLTKFGIAMVCVIISVIFLVLCLKIYKKIVGNKASDNINNVDYNKVLESPKDISEAINLFLYKTDK